MGVYIFRSFHGPFIKVGHYAGKNAFCRVAHRGFSSCVCPKELRGRVAMEDMELLAWYPMLDRKMERMVKTRWRKHRIYGKSEWFPVQQLEEIKAFLDDKGVDMVHTCDPYAAMITRRRL